MRLLIVNPNTSEGVTSRINAAAQEVACEKRDEFLTVSAACGPELIVTDQDGLDAVDGVLASVNAHADGVDGIVLASFGDTGTEAVRLAYPTIPVVGIASAAFAVARCLGGNFSMVTFDEKLTPSLRARAMFYGMNDLLFRVEGVSDQSEYNAADVQTERFEAMQALCVDCAKDPVSSIIMGGGPLAGISSRIKTTPKIPIIDGTQAAICILRSSIDS
ncbi:MAG: aspartate/glutamate racemase family protein [Granulosicoccus sp.]